MTYLPRFLGATIRSALHTFPAVLVTGARQTGKTTLLRYGLQTKARYVSLERPDVRARALDDPVGFLGEVDEPTILDEIQYAPELLHYVKERIDSDRAPGRWLLTGSQTLSLMRGASQTMSGRVAVLRLDSLSAGEVAESPNRSVDDVLDRVFSPTTRGESHPVPSVTDWLLRGGFPEPRLNDAVDRQLWFGSYVQTYLERDVRDLAQVADLEAFRRFVMLLGARTATVLNMAHLGRDAGISGPTAKRWLSVLETSGLVFRLPPYHRSFGKRIRRSPKIYMLDPGLATFVLGLHSAEAVQQGPSFGQLVETAVVSEWVKLFHQNGEAPTLSYWQSNATAEVDLIVERNGKLYGIEVKATATPQPRHGDGIARWLDLVGPTGSGVVACNIARPSALRRGIRAVPWHLAW
jgi:predicted AAA+ superfamily ATPase